ncbi:MAG: right-handed parallel beta-helix repeat-containing protein [Candidatus Thorarchaeota archaeon]|nr:right-handed parallel beta-helix repeat-containing protein [Candidatus Thorarchaeota archaeon]
MLRRNETLWVAVFAILILFLFTIPLNAYQNSLGDISANQCISSKIARPSGDIPHVTIDILSDDDFDTQSWPGSGIESDPYRIENLNITGGSNDPCIDIQDTRAHFIIKNCTFWGPSNDPSIQLSNVTNGRIIDNEFSDSWMAIGAFSSADLNVTSNWFNNTFNGISLTGPRMIIHSNTMMGAGQGRIYVKSAENSTIFNNTLFEMASGVGVQVYDSKNVIITNNTCQGINMGYKIHGSSEYCLLANNSAYDGRVGIIIDSNWVSVIMNNITLVGKEALFLGGSFCTIASNYFSESSDGIWIYGSYNTIENNTCYQNTRGIVSNITLYNSIVGNIFDSNTWNAIDNVTLNFFGTNYWSDYLGADSNSDGIGDTPYSIPGTAGNQDAHPLMTPSTPRFVTNWIDVPTFQHVEWSHSFQYLMNCTAPAPLEWWLTGWYSEDFSIDSNGLITNATVWDSYPTTWSLTVWGRNIYSYAISAIFVVNHTDTLAPVWDQIPVDQVHEYRRYAQSFRYDLNATDLTSINRYWVNDTARFSIDTDGLLRSEVILEIGEVYGLEVRVNDTLGHYSSATFSITVQDTIMPEIDSPSDEVFDEGMEGQWSISWQVFDESLQKYTLLLNGSILESGTFDLVSEFVDYDVTLDGISVGVHNYTLVVEDEAGNVASDSVLITIRPFSTPTDTTTVSPPPIQLELIIAVVVIGVVVIIVSVYIMRRRRT